MRVAAAFVAGPNVLARDDLYFEPITLRNRGAAAWERDEVAEFERELSGGASRLLAHGYEIVLQKNLLDPAVDCAAGGS